MHDGSLNPVPSEDPGFCSGWFCEPDSPDGFKPGAPSKLFWDIAPSQKSQETYRHHPLIQIHQERSQKFQRFWRTKLQLLSIIKITLTQACWYSLSGWPSLVLMLTGQKRRSLGGCSLPHLKPLEILWSSPPFRCHQFPGRGVLSCLAILVPIVSGPMVVLTLIDLLELFTDVSFFMAQSLFLFCHWGRSHLGTFQLAMTLVFSSLVLIHTLLFSFGST